MHIHIFVAGRKIRTLALRANTTALLMPGSTAPSCHKYSAVVNSYSILTTSQLYSVFNASRVAPIPVSVGTHAHPHEDFDNSSDSNLARTRTSNSIIITTSVH